jgi:hypothetical protein
MPRIEAVSLDAATGPEGQVMALLASCRPELPSRYRCRLITKSGRHVFDRMMFATSIRHTITRDQWTARITLDVAEPFAVGGGRWDHQGWDRSAWSVAV